MVNRNLSWHDFVASEVFHLLLHLIHDVDFKALVQIMLFKQYFCETLQSQVGFVFVPEKDLSQALAFDLNVYFDWDQTSKLIFWLVK
jgi:hypothetical protein